MDKNKMIMKRLAAIFYDGLLITAGFWLGWYTVVWLFK